MADTDTMPARPPSRAAGRLKIHHLRPAPGARTERTRVGRGEASKGKTAGRGTKGSKAREPVPAGVRGRPDAAAPAAAEAQGLLQRPVQDHLPGREPRPAGGAVPRWRRSDSGRPRGQGAVRTGELVKVLGQGEITAALHVSAHAFSATASAKITAAGGTVTEL